MKKEEIINNQTILRGIVLPVQWDETGNVVKISINTYDEKEYLINGDGRGRELFNHLKELVEIQGGIAQKTGSAEWVKVHRYSILKPFEA